MLSILVLTQWYIKTIRIRWVRKSAWQYLILYQDCNYFIGSCTSQVDFKITKMEKSISFFKEPIDV